MTRKAGLMITRRLGADSQRLAGPAVRRVLRAGKEIRDGIRARVVEPHGKRRTVIAAPELPLTCDRALLLAEIPTVSVFGTPPSDAAKEWGGVLLRQAETSFTVLLAPEPWDMTAMVRDLQLFDPTSIQVIEAPTAVRIHLDGRHARVWDSVPVHPTKGYK
jgi:hypothetical protein